MPYTINLNYLGMIGSHMCPVSAMLGQLWVNPGLMQPTTSARLPTGSWRTRPLETNSSHPVITGSRRGGSIISQSGVTACPSLGQLETYKQS